MKPSPWWEVTDPTAPVIQPNLDEMDARRPTETEADLIAAAAPIGHVYSRQMAEVLLNIIHPWNPTDVAHSHARDLDEWFEAEGVVAQRREFLDRVLVGRASTGTALHRLVEERLVAGEPWSEVALEPPRRRRGPISLG